MSHTDTPTVWMMLALVGDPSTNAVTWSVQGQATDKPATFTVDGSWASDIATATQEYLQQVTSIYANYALFQGLTDDRIEEGTIGLGSGDEQDRRSEGEGTGI